MTETKTIPLNGTKTDKVNTNIAKKGGKRTERNELDVPKLNKTQKR